MSGLRKIILRLKQGSRLSAQETRTILNYLGYNFQRQKGSHEQWVNGGRIFTLACHGKEIPFYILDTLKKMIEEKDENKE